MSKWGYKSNMGGFAEERLAGLLKQQYQLEYELEKAKQDLILQCTDFTCIAGFKLFDPPENRLQGLGFKNVQQAFKRLGVTLSDKNAKLLLKRLDHDCDGSLSYVDICELFIPKNAHIKAQLLSRKELTTKMSSGTARMLRTLLHQTLLTENQVEKLRKHLVEYPHFDYQAAYQTLARLQKENLSNIQPGEMKLILQNYGLFTLSHDLESLFVRFDKKKGGLITFRDFQTEIMPLK